MGCTVASNEPQRRMDRTMVGFLAVVAALAVACDPPSSVEVTDDPTTTSSPAPAAGQSGPQEQTTAPAAAVPTDPASDEPFAPPDEGEIAAMETCDQVHDATLSWILDDLVAEMQASFGDGFPPATPDPEMGYHDLNLAMNMFSGDPRERYAGLGPRGVGERADALACDLEGEYAAIATRLGAPSTGLARDRGLAEVVDVRADELDIGAIVRFGLASRVLAGPPLPDDEALLGAFVAEVVDALEGYHATHGRYPDDLTDLLGTPVPDLGAGPSGVPSAVVLGSDEQAWCVAVLGPRGRAVIAESTGRREDLDLGDPPDVVCPDTQLDAS